jgi:hypothetical protein
LFVGFRRLVRAGDVEDRRVRFITARSVRRPDIDAGPIGRKCRASNDPPAAAGAEDCSERPTSD